MKTTMKKSVLDALAIARATGSFPTHLHLMTWSDAFALVSTNSSASCRYELNDDAIAATDDHALVVRLNELKRDGWSVEVMKPTRKSRGVRVRHEDGSTAVVYLDGTAWARTDANGRWKTGKF